LGKIEAANFEIKAWNGEIKDFGWKN